MKLCAKHDYGRRMSENHTENHAYITDTNAYAPTLPYSSLRPPPNPVISGYMEEGYDGAPMRSFSGSISATPFQQGNSRSFDSSMSSSALRRPKIRSYKSHFKQRYLVETAWRTGGQNAARHITQDSGVVTSLHLTPNYIVVALDNAKIHVFNTDGINQKTLQGHVMGVWAMVPWGDTLVSGGCDRDVRVWNMATGYANLSAAGMWLT
jgi:F-box and WD-40 domain protein CDC4